MSLKTYLNGDETIEFLQVSFLVDSVYRILNNWNGRGQLTKDEHRSLKMVHTYIEKFYKSVLARLDKKESTKINKRRSNYSFEFLDRYSQKRIFGEWEAEYQVVKMPREVFEDWTEKVLESHCKNCNTNFGDCKLYDLLDDCLVAESGHDLKNCKFAYKKSKKK